MVFISKVFKFGWDFGISSMYQGIRVFYACRIVNLKSYWYDLLSENSSSRSSPFRSSQHKIISMKVIVLSHSHDFYKKHPACRIYNTTIFLRTESFRT